MAPSCIAVGLVLVYIATAFIEILVKSTVSDFSWVHHYSTGKTCSFRDRLTPTFPFYYGRFLAHLCALDSTPLLLCARAHDAELPSVVSGCGGVRRGGGVANGEAGGGERMTNTNIGDPGGS